MRTESATQFHDVSNSTRSADDPSWLSQHAMELAMTATGASAGGGIGMASVMAYESGKRALLSAAKWPLATGLSMLGGGQGARFALDGVESAVAASREAEAARLLPAAAIGLIAGTALAFAGYEWLTSDKQKHSI